MRRAKRRHEKPTLMWIPEAHRPVRRSRLTRTAIWSAAGCLAASVTAFALWQGLLRDDLEQTIGKLSGQVSLHEQAYEDMQHEKDAAIVHLQEQLFQLSEQADRLEGQMQQIRELENQLKTLAAEPEFSYEDTGNDGVRMLKNSLALGGELRDVEKQRFDDFVDETFDRFEEADAEARKLVEQLELTKAALEAKVEELRTTPSIYPSDSRSVTSGFGFRRDPFTGRATFHYGIDFDGDTGDPAYATADGEVVETGSDSQKGRYVVIRHRDSLRTVYMHLNRIRVSTGDFVEKGDRIGDVGNTGRSTGSHLHYEVHEHGREVNPYDYLP